MKMRTLVLACTLVIAAAAEAAAQSVTLAWDPSSGPDVAGYLVSWGRQSGKYEHQADAGNATSFTVPNLLAGQRYFFAVQAYSSAPIASSFSSEVAAYMAL